MPCTAFIAPAATISSSFLKLLDPIARHLKYLFEVSDHVEDLRLNIQILKARKEDIQKTIETAERQSRKPTKEVEVWLQHVAAIAPEVEIFLSDYENRCWGHASWAFFSCCSNYLIGMRCADILEEVKELCKRASFDAVTVELPPPPVEKMPTDFEVPDSLDSNHKKAVDYIDDKDAAGLIAIWGMGGVGKTTLLKKINNSCIKSSKFDHVIWIVVSKDCKPDKVQKSIVNKLRLREDDDPQSQSNIISSFLSNKNFLLLLDDLWERLDLLGIGIPHPLGVIDHKSRKVVITTRSNDVCGNMEADRRIKVECLNSEESLLLFKEKVGEEVLNMHPHIRSLAEEVVKECDGLPLALITIGRAMSTKISPRDWEYAILLLKQSRLPKIPGTEKNTFPLLKFSYDSLESNEMRKCFLCCAMWPEDFNIRKEELIECWMGLNIIDNIDNIEDVYLFGHSLIGSLQAACLLEVGDEDEREISGMYVKMHDVIRDLALWIASDCGQSEDKWMVKAGTGLREAPQTEEKWSKAERISLMHNSITELPSIVPTCTNLIVLMLQNTLLEHSPRLNCFLGFQALKYLNLSCTALNVFPIVLCALVELQYLNVSYTNIGELPEKLKNLKKLKYLILRETAISSVPEGVLFQLGKLKVLDLFTYTRYCYGSFVDELKCLEGHLKFLGVTAWSDEDLEKLVLLSGLCVGALCVQDLRVTSFRLLSSIGKRNLQLHLKELRISECHNGLTELVIDRDDQDDDFPAMNVETLHFVSLSQFQRITWRAVTPLKLLHKLTKVTFHSCCRLEHIAWVIHLPCLEQLEIYSCDAMREAITSVEDDDVNGITEVETPNATFPSLKILFFSSLKMLHSISKCALTFPELRYVKILGCPLLKELPFESEAAASKLQKISGGKDWWANLEWKDANVRSHYHSLFKEHSQ